MKTDEPHQDAIPSISDGLDTAPMVPIRDKLPSDRPVLRVSSGDDSSQELKHLVSSNRNSVKLYF